MMKTKIKEENCFSPTHRLNILTIHVYKGKIKKDSHNGDDRIRHQMVSSEIVNQYVTVVRKEIQYLADW